MTTPLQEAINDLRFMRDRATDAFSDIVWGMAISILRDVHIEKERQFLDAAREDEAVGFAEWVADNNKHKYRAGWGDMTGKDIRYYTTKQLYQLYQKSKQKQAITDIMNDDERDGLYDDKNQNL